MPHYVPLANVQFKSPPCTETVSKNQIFIKNILVEKGAGLMWKLKHPDDVRKCFKEYTKKPGWQRNCKNKLWLI